MDGSTPSESETEQRKASLQGRRLRQHLQQPVDDMDGVTRVPALLKAVHLWPCTYVLVLADARGSVEHRNQINKHSEDLLFSLVG